MFKNKSCKIGLLKEEKVELLNVREIKNIKFPRHFLLQYQKKKDAAIINIFSVSEEILLILRGEKLWIN